MLRFLFMRDLVVIGKLDNLLHLLTSKLKQDMRILILEMLYEQYGLIKALKRQIIHCIIFIIKSERRIKLRDSPGLLQSACAYLTLKSLFIAGIQKMVHVI